MASPSPYTPPPPLHLAPPLYQNRGPAVYTSFQWQSKYRGDWRPRTAGSCINTVDFVLPYNTAVRHVIRAGVCGLGAGVTGGMCAM